MTESVKAYLYPIMEEGNLSYPEGSYEHDFAPGKNPCSVVLTHKLLRCPFLEKWLEKGRAEFACAVSIPKAGYRRVHTSSDNVQEIQWSEDDLGEPPYFRPFIVATEPIKGKLTKEDGVSEEWVSHEVDIKKGAKIGFGPLYRMASSLQHLLSVHLDEELDDGALCIEECTEDGYYFKVFVAADLHRFLRYPGEHPMHRMSIFTHIVSSCFKLLHDRYTSNREGEDWNNFSNLRALQKMFEQNEVEMWDSDNFSPDEAATKLYPHCPPLKVASEE